MSTQHFSFYSGKRIVYLDKGSMGCAFPTWTIIVAAVGSITFVIFALVVNRKWEAIKFYIFIHFNVLTNDDGPEDLTDMDFDAFVTYRYMCISNNSVSATAVLIRSVEILHF